MSLRLQRIGEADIPVMYALLVLCGEHMHRTLGLSHWYPFRPYDIYRQQLDSEHLYAIYADDVLGGTFALNPQPRPYYHDGLWKHSDASALYFGLFGVLPSFQGQGIGRWAMEQVNTLVQSEGYTAVRFDAVANHPTLLRFYDRLGYERRGVLSFEHPMMKDCICYERSFGTDR